MFKTWHSPLNHGINCGRRNEQVVSQPFLFWFGLSSSSLDKFPFFLLSFPFFPLFICLCICMYFFLFFFFSSIFFLFTTSSYSFSSSSFAPSSSPFFFWFNSSSYFSSRFTSSLFSSSFPSLSGRKYRKKNYFLWSQHVSFQTPKVIWEDK